MCFEKACLGAVVVVAPSYTVVTGLSPGGRTEMFACFAYRAEFLYCSRSLTVTSSIRNRMGHSTGKRSGLSTGKEIILSCLKP